MEKGKLDPRLRLIQQAPMKGKVVLLRVDHNVVKKGQIKDPYRIDATIGTLYAIAAQGGKPVLMTHIGRPKDKKTGKIVCREDQSVIPIVRYLEQKLPVTIHVQGFPIDPEKGIIHTDKSIGPAIEALREGKIDMIYLPNSRWFQGEQSKGPERQDLADELGSIADIYVNDAFGSWRAHASTYDISHRLPSYAGILLQKELMNLHRVLEPERPFIAVVAGAKYDTKIGPLKALYKKVDHLILGGLMYNTFLSAKYGAEIAGVSEEDRALAMELVELDRDEKKILEMPYFVESERTEEKAEGQYRTIGIENLKERGKIKYILDIDPASFQEQRVVDAITTARTIFVNAVMGLMPLFFEGSQALYRLIAENEAASKLFAGGDTLQELRNLCPGIYMAGLDDPATYYFTGGGSVLAAIEEGTPYHLKPVEALMNGITLAC
ncbi:MAG: phosphoglycerate kinase [Pseudomonadota bacterium]|nr:phosphoglycerate kinase [Desulfobacterales bacterium]MBL6967891.1 phosphoglycerate kinase [Desulfobacteraceae bacterium]MBU0735677.1 phosphoglycerate kinase [Pseudomonadota bacterium]MBL7101767.1 phosphoglycerate kinase [Desulfobacteraceae bacterium]MBL7172589.1 phosphoglycerate kinase [Desulfobacteraceae bacterium]